MAELYTSIKTQFYGLLRAISTIKPSLNFISHCRPIKESTHDELDCKQHKSAVYRQLPKYQMYLTLNIATVFSLEV